MRSSPLLFSLILLATLLSACSSRPPATPEPASLEPNAELWHWQAQGRLSINDGQERHSANLDWEQNGYHYQLLIFGPLGQGSARLDGQPFRVRLTTSDGKTLAASSPEELIRQGLGWDLPLSNLVYWIRALPAPGEYQSLTSNQLLQGPWDIEWRRFTEVEGYQLPSLLIARRGELELRLAINSWTLKDAP